MIEIIDGVAREYEWHDGEWVLVEDSPWNRAPLAPPTTEDGETE